MAKRLLDIGPLELEVLGLLGAGEEQSVGDVQVRLKGGGHELAYTTVMTVMSRLYQKGMLQRRKEGRSFLYRPAKKHESSTVGILERVKKSLFQAERLKPILTLLHFEEDLSRAELEELKRAIDDRLKRTKS